MKEPVGVQKKFCKYCKHYIKDKYRGFCPMNLSRPYPKGSCERWELRSGCYKGVRPGHWKNY